MESDSIRPHFERPSVKGSTDSDVTEFKLLNEQPFETQYDGQWVSGVIDRAVIRMENGKPAHVTIIDFKTDSGIDASELRRKYTAQLETYRAAMSEITGVPGGNISCYLLSTSLKEMVEV